MRLASILSVGALLGASSAYADTFNLGDGTNVDIYGSLKFTLNSIDGDKFYVFSPDVTANVNLGSFGSSGNWGISFESGGSTFGDGDFVLRSIGLYGSVYIDHALGRTYIGKPKSSFAISEYILGHSPQDLFLGYNLPTLTSPDGFLGQINNAVPLGAFGIRHEYESGNFRASASVLRSAGLNYTEFGLAASYALPFGNIFAGYSHLDLSSGSQSAFGLGFHGESGPLSYGLSYSETYSNYEIISAFLNYQFNQQWSAEANVLRYDVGLGETIYSISAIYALNQSVNLRAFYSRSKDSDFNSYGFETAVSFGNHYTGKSGGGGVNVDIAGDVQLGVANFDLGSGSENIYTLAPNTDVAIYFDEEGNTSSGPSLGLSFEIDGGAITVIDSTGFRQVNYNPSIFFDNQFGRTYVGSPEDAFARAQYVTDHAPNGYFRFIREFLFFPNSRIEALQRTTSASLYGVRHDGEIGNLDYSVSMHDVNGSFSFETEFSASASYELATAKFGELELLFALMFGLSDGYMLGVTGDINQFGYGLSHRRVESSTLAYKSTAGFLNYQINDTFSTELYVERFDTPTSDDTYRSLSVSAEIAPGTDISIFGGKFASVNEYGISIMRTF